MWADSLALLVAMNYIMLVTHGRIVVRLILQTSSQFNELLQGLVLDHLMNSDAVIELVTVRLKNQCHLRKWPATLFKQFRLLQTHSLRILCR